MRRRPSSTVFDAIHDGDPDPKLLAYQYLQTLPQIAQGDANKIWIVPGELVAGPEGAIGRRARPASSATTSSPPAAPGVTPATAQPPTRRVAAVRRGGSPNRSAIWPAMRSTSATYQSAWL